MNVRLSPLRASSHSGFVVRRRPEPDNPTFYEAYWQTAQSDADPFVVRKIAELLQLIPPDVQTVVDVGCGDGTLTAALAQRFHVQAIDRSAEALARVAQRAPHVKRLRASAENLPLPSRSADLVFSSELLEHLPHLARAKAVREMARVTRRWLLVSVPNQEVLRRRFARCPNCEMEFNVYGHLQSYTSESLAAQFPEFVVRAQLEHGRPEQRTHPRIEQFRQQRAGRWFVYSGLHVTCPGCGWAQFAPPRSSPAQSLLNVGAQLAQGIWRFAQPDTVKPYWISVLLERTSDDADPEPPPVQSHVARDVGAVVTGRVAVAALDSLKLFALFRLLDKAAYGTLAFALTWHLTAVTLGTLSIPDSLLALLPRTTPGQQAGLARQSLRFLSGLGLLAGLTVLGIGHLPAFLPAGQPALPALLPWIALAIAADLPAQMLQAFLLGLRQHRMASTQAMGLAVLTHLALIVPVLLGANLPQIAASFALASVARLLVTAWTVSHAFPGIQPEPFTGGLRAQLAMAIPLTLTGAAATINRQLVTWTAGFLLPAVLFADFAVGAQELPLVAMLPNAVAVALLPHLTQFMSQPEHRRQGLALWHASILRVSLIMLPVWVWCTVEAAPLLAALGGAGWRSAALPFRITALLLPLRVTAYGTMLLALGLPREVLKAQIAAIATTLATCTLLWLTHALGLLDAQTALVCGCAAFVLSQFVAIALLLRSIARGSQVAWHQAFPWRLWAVRLIVAVVAMVPVQLLPTVALTGTPGEVLNLSLRTLVYAALTLTFYRQLDLLTAADRGVVGRWLTLEPLRKRRAVP